MPAANFFRSRHYQEIFDRKMREKGFADFRGGGLAAAERVVNTEILRDIARGMWSTDAQWAAAEGGDDPFNVPIPQGIAIPVPQEPAQWVVMDDIQLGPDPQPLRHIAAGGIYRNERWGPVHITVGPLKQIVEVPRRRFIRVRGDGSFNIEYLGEDQMAAIQDGQLEDMEAYLDRVGGIDARPVEDLDLDKLEPDMSDRRVNLPPFRLNYETVEEAKLRLRNTIVAIKGVPFIVTDVGMRGGAILYLENDEDGRKKVALNDKIDLRSYAPGYVTAANNAVYYLFRRPERVFQQGLNTENTRLRSLGTGANHPFNLHDLLPMLRHRNNHKWNGRAEEMFEAKQVNQLRLSNNVAVYRKVNKLNVEYKGRLLGYIKGRGVVLEDEDDVLQSWINQDLRTVGLEPVVEG